jgi:2-dehydro-3-deoxyphosphogluconate aldolase/(4S)-4-hydroxy-2-oxoglutarate aldolase
LWIGLARHGDTSGRAVLEVEAPGATFGGVRFVPTGGVTAANLPDYPKLPSVFAVGERWLVSGKLLAAGAFEEVTRLAREAVEIVARERGHGGRQ